MALIRWNPGSDLMNIHSEMDRLFGDLTEGMRAQGNGGRGETSAILPVDIERTDDALVIYASVPGFSPDEVDVTVDNGVLTIDARHPQEGEEEQRQRNFIRQERYTGRLYRQIALGEGVKSEDARATFHNGVLTVTVPLAPRPQPKRIPVQAAGAANGAERERRAAEREREPART
jgi:HSP20 family protein